jgi:hypothetical protein
MAGFRIAIALLVLAWFCHVGNAFAELPPQPVRALFDDLAQINGDAASSSLPVLCFEVSEASLPDPRRARNRTSRVELRARRAVVEEALSHLAQDLVMAYRVGGSVGSPIVVRVIGHADSTSLEGKPDHNARLSYERALTVKNILRTDVAWFGGVFHPRLTFEVEGRSTFEPWPNRADHCTSLPRKNFAEAVAVSPPIPADRRVEIEIISGAVTSAGPEKAGSEEDRRLRVYPIGTMPWRPVVVPLVEPPQNGATKIVRECFDGTIAAPQTPWITLRDRNLIDYSDGGMAVRFRSTPVYAPALKGMRVDLELARDENGAGVPGYWSVHERLPKFIDEVQITHPEVNDDLVRLAKCIALQGEVADAGYFKRHQSEITKAALDRLPKDIDGIMAAAVGLHRHLRFVDLNPDMTVQMKGSFQDYTAKRLQPATPETFKLVSDPINPCIPDPVPRAADGDGPIAERASFRSTIADAFLAWMTHSENWLCGSAGSPTDVHPALVPEAGATVVAAVSGGDTPDDLKAEHFRIGAFSQLELLLSRGPTRLFLPMRQYPEPLTRLPNQVPQQARSDGTFIVAGGEVAGIDDFTRRAAPDGKYQQSDFNVYSACTALDTDNPTHCGMMFAQETFTPLVSIIKNKEAVQMPLGTRVVHLLPATVYDGCFKNNLSDQWPVGAQLTTQITWTTPMLPKSALIDRRDCRLLGLPMVPGGSVSW